MKEALKRMENNSTEILTGAILFVGFPLVASLYFDYRAGLLVFCLIGAVIGVLAIRSK